MRRLGVCMVACLVLGACKGGGDDSGDDDDAPGSDAAPADAAPPDAAAPDAAPPDAAPEADAFVAPPDTTITAGPSGAVASDAASLSFTSNDAMATFECRLDGAAFAACTSPTQLTTLSEGAHTFEVRAVNSGGPDPTPATRAWTVDTTPPDTTITAGPSGAVASTAAELAFSSADATATLQCRLDGAAFGPCTSPAQLTGLSEGLHTFEVRAVDPAGNLDPTPATRAWTVDTTPPDTTITAGPSGPVNTTSASFSFSSADATATFQCRVDGAAFAPCTSPAQLTGLSAAPHTFEVRAVDPAGNLDATPASRTWTVDVTPPDTTIGSKPPALTDQSSATFTFTSGDASATFSCSLDGAAFAPCTSPRTLMGLAQGEHTFAVRATDSAGNPDPTPATHTWTFDLDECALATHTCGPTTRCHNLVATFDCIGDGALLCLDGVNDRGDSAQAAPSSIALLDTFTVELWFRSNGATGEQDLVNLDSSPVSGARRLRLAIGDGPAMGFGTLSGRTIQLAVDARDAGGALNARGFDIDAALPGFDETKWHHYAAVLNGTTQRMFIDGVELTTAQQRDGSQATSLVDAFGPAFVSGGGQVVLGVGYFIRDGIRFLNGALEELRLSDTARYTGAFTPPYPLAPDADTIMSYALDEGTGGQSFDTSGNAHTITWTGATWSTCP